MADSPTLAGTPLAAMNATWRSWVAGLPSEDRARLIVEADGLYPGGRDDRRRALHCWLALRGSLDPRAPRDAPRVLAVLLGVPPGLEDLEAFARRAEEEGSPELRQAASIVLGRLEADRGRPGPAERRFRSVLTAVRGSGGRMEYLACSSLAGLCLRENREFEALVLSRRLLALGETAAEETRLRYAFLVLANALAGLGEWDLVDGHLAAIDRSLEGREPSYERTLRFFARALAARRAFAKGDPVRAAEETEKAAALQRTGTSLGGEERVLLLLRARVEEAAGRWTAAEALLAYDLAAAAVLLRVIEIGRCLRDLPELAAIEPEDERVLREARTRFLREHRTLLEHVKRRLLEDEGRGGALLKGFLREGPYMRVCAWCRRVLGEGRVWVPVGHFLPLGPDLPVSHGICPSCVDGFRAGR
jgi:hypothetical protein